MDNPQFYNPTQTPGYAGGYPLQGGQPFTHQVPPVSQSIPQMQQPLTPGEPRVPFGGQQTFQQPVSPQSQTYTNQEQQDENLEDKFLKKQEEVTNEIVKLNENLKDGVSMHDLLNVIYGVRQRHVEYHHTLMGLMAKLSTKYKKRHAELFNFYKTQSQIKYTDTAINIQCDACLSDMLQNSALLNTHIKFMEQSIKTIDHMIYGVSQKIELLKLMNGVKF
jgi:hypothetical protein